MPLHDNHPFSPLFRRGDDAHVERGRHLVATQRIPKGRLIFMERPLVALQSLGNPVWVCHACKAFVGGPHAGLSILADRTYPNTVASSDQDDEDDDCDIDDIENNDASWKVVPCRHACGQVYCSKACEQDFWEARHQYLCTGKIGTESGESDDHPLIQFKQHAITTNEIFLLVAEWIVAEYTLLQKQHQSVTAALDDDVPWIQPSDIFLAAATKSHKESNPFQDFLMEPWWDIEEASKNDEDAGATKEVLKKLCQEASQFWQEHWQQLSATHNDITHPPLDAAQMDNDHSPLQMARIIGACELNSIGVRRRNPLCRDIFSKELRTLRKREILACLEQAGMLEPSPENDNDKNNSNSYGHDESSKREKDEEGQGQGDDGRYSNDFVAGFLTGLTIFEEETVVHRRSDDEDVVTKSNKESTNGVAVNKNDAPEEEEEEEDDDDENDCDSEGDDDGHQHDNQDDYDDLDMIFTPLDGTAMYALCCKMNHSCDPNVVVMYKTGGWGPLHPLVAHVVALRDIEEGEELCISYIDTCGPLEKRQEELAHYGFTCRCSKCDKEMSARDNYHPTGSVEPAVDDADHPTDSVLFGSDDSEADDDGSNAGDADAKSNEQEGEIAPGEEALVQELRRLDTVLNHSSMGTIPLHCMAQASNFVVQTAKVSEKNMQGDHQWTDCDGLLRQSVSSVLERDYVLAKTVGPRLERVLFSILKKESKWPTIAYREAYWCAAVTAAVGFAHIGSFLPAVRYLDRAHIMGLDRSLVNEFFSYVEYHASQIAICPWLPTLNQSHVKDYGSSHFRRFLIEQCLSAPVRFPVEEHAVGDETEILSSISNGKVVVIRQYASTWPAVQKWRCLSFFCRYFGHRLVPIEVGSMISGSGMKEALMTFRHFVSRYLSESAAKDFWTLEDAVSSEGSIAYLAQHPLVKQIPELGFDIDLQPSLCGRLGPSHVYLWIGTGGTRTPLHFDSYSNIFVQLVGTKYVRIYSAEETPRLYVSKRASFGLQGNMSDVDCEHEDFDRFPLARDAKFQEVILFPGDALHIPSRSWHYVRSLTTSMSVNFWF